MFGNKSCFQKNFNAQKFGKFHPSGSLGKNLSEISEIMLTGKKIPVVNKNSSLQAVVAKISSGRLGCAIVIENNKKYVALYLMVT